MDGMLVAYHRVSTGGRGKINFSNTLRLPRPTAVIAEISLSTFDTASASFGTPITAFAVFTACTTDGTNPPLPPSETFARGSLSGASRRVRPGSTATPTRRRVLDCPPVDPSADLEHDGPTAAGAPAAG